MVIFNSIKIIFFIILLNLIGIKGIFVSNGCGISFEQINFHNYHTFNRSLSNIHLNYSILRCGNINDLINSLENRAIFELENSLQAIEINFDDFNLALNLSTELLKNIQKITNKYTKTDLLILSNISRIFMTPENVWYNLFNTTMINRVIIRNSNLKLVYSEYLNKCELSSFNYYCGLDWMTSLSIDHLYIFSSVNLENINCLYALFFSNITNLYFYNVSQKTSNKTCNFSVNFQIYAAPLNMIIIDSNFYLKKDFLLNFVNLQSLLIYNSYINIEYDLFKLYWNLNFISFKLNDFGYYVKNFQNNWTSSYGSINPIDFNDCYSITNKLRKIY